MLDYAGTLQRLVLSRTLWLLFAWPLAGLAWQLTVARTRIARSPDGRAMLRALDSSRIAGLGSIVLAASTLLGHAILLARLPAGARALVEPCARVGGLDAGFELLLDSRGLAACALACVATLAAGAVLASRPPAQRGWRTWAWLQLALSGALVSVLGAGFLTVAMGWTLASAAGAWLAGWYDAGAGAVVATRGAAALAALLVGAALLFWGFEGSWDDGYTPDPQPRFAAVHVGGGAAEASLTMTSVAGATVYLDDARTSSLRAPFTRAPLAAGSHPIRIHPGDGADDAVLARAEVAPGEEIALVPLGPTLSFRTLAEQLGLHDRQGAPVVRRALEEHAGPGGFAVVEAALIALLAAAGAMSAWSLPVAAPPALVAAAAGATTSALGPFLLIRLAFLFPLAPASGRVVTSVGVATVLTVMWQALRFVGVRRWLVFAAGSPAGLTLVAAGRGETGVALGVMVLSGLGSAASFLLVASGVPVAQHGETTAPGADTSLDETLLSRVPAAVGDLLVSMDRWVVGAVASAMGGTVRIAAWTLARLDEHVISRPADAVAGRLQRSARMVEPWVGAPLARLVWALLAAAALASVASAAWPRG
jgi:hypothetical protein